MSKRIEEGFSHGTDPVAGAETKITRHSDGSGTVAFGDGSESLKITRRDFTRLTSAAVATAAMSTAACRNPVENIVPYVDRPEQIRIGHPNYYATTWTGGAGHYGVLVKTRTGRPIKVEGNPSHPASLGGLCARGQSSYMGLYDPARAQGPLEVKEDGGHRPIEWDKVDGAVSSAIKAAANGGGIGLLTTTLNGSGRGALIRDIQKSIPTFTHYTYEPLNAETAIRASEVSYNVSALPHYDFKKANYILALGSDFLGTYLSPVEFTKGFSSRRNPDGKMNKLVSFEGQMSLTGMNADERFPVNPKDLPQIALAIANVVIVERGVSKNGAFVAAVSAFTPAAVSAATGVPAEVLTKVGRQLADEKGNSIVIAGGMASATSYGLELEVAVNLLNSALGNDGKTIKRTRPSLQSKGKFSDLMRLISDIETGKVDVLIIDDANPIYSAPASLKLEKALKKVKLVVSTTDRVDETSRFADYLAPSGTFLESWGDAISFVGVFAIQQPVIQPIYNTRSLEESLLAWFAGSDLIPALKPFLKTPKKPTGNVPGKGLVFDAGAWYRYLRNHWKQEVFPLAKSLSSFDAFWDDTLRVGVFNAQLPTLPEPKLNVNALKGLPKQPVGTAAKALPLSKKNVQLFTSIPLYDGRDANNGHLQELPDPVTKHVWGSYVCVSPKTFKREKLAQGQYIELSFGAATQKYQVIMQPGLHDDVIAIPVGYGRTHVGSIGDGVGENAFAFSKISKDQRQIFDNAEIKIKKLQDGDVVAIEQGAQVIDLHRRPIAAHTTLSEYKNDPAAGIHAHPELRDMWVAHKYDVKWGMSIDLSKCTGCSACVIACQEENNIPVVGREGVTQGRIMHWMRVDRYYLLPHAAYIEQKDPINDPMFENAPVEAFSKYMDNPSVINQPMLCQHCEKASCETVCPVSATMHSEDGLNQMIYNRCVGTRYCSNNCPFKVRRFNWFNYVTDRSDSVFARIYPQMKEHAELNVKGNLQDALNPDVTVRSRGVMEKCTFCVQRIRRAKTQLRKEGRSEMKDGDVVTACQQSCPADAIVFGDLIDKNSQVAKDHAKKRALSPLAEIGMESSIAYLTRVVNAPAVQKEHKKQGEGHNNNSDGHGDKTPASDHG